MSSVVPARPWPEIAADLRRMTPSSAEETSPLATLADQIAASPYAASVYGAVSLGNPGGVVAPVLQLAQTPWFDPERGAVSAVEERGRVVLRYHQAPGEASVIAEGGDLFQALERFLVERRWFTRSAR